MLIYTNKNKLYLSLWGVIFGPHFSHSVPDDFKRFNSGAASRNLCPKRFVCAIGRENGETRKFTGDARAVGLIHFPGVVMKLCVVPGNHGN